MRKLELSVFAVTWTANRKKEIIVLGSSTQLVKEINNTHIHSIYININAPSSSPSRGSQAQDPWS